ncbi:EF-hand domain-containing protein [Streptomyces sp. M10(2022)]
MLGQIQKTNMDRVFDTLDVTSDGHISADDFKILAQRMRALRPNMPTKLAAEIDEAFTSWWEGFRSAADTDGDGQITREEFIAAVEHGLENDPTYADRMVKVSEVTFRAADTEGDEYLNPLQIERIYRAFGVNEQHSTETIARLDRNGDGRISVDEYVQAAREVYLSNDPKAPAPSCSAPWSNSWRGDTP